MNVSYYGYIIVVNSFDNELFQTPSCDTYESALIELGMRSMQFNYEDIIGYQIIEVNNETDKITTVYEKRIPVKQIQAERKYIKENFNKWSALCKETKKKWLDLCNFRDAVSGYYCAGEEYPLKGEQKMNEFNIALKDSKYFKIERYHYDMFEVHISYACGMFEIQIYGGWDIEQQVPEYGFGLSHNGKSFYGGFETALRATAKDVKESNCPREIKDLALSALARACVNFHLKHHGNL